MTSWTLSRLHSAHRRVWYCTVHLYGRRQSIFCERCVCIDVSRYLRLRSDLRFSGSYGVMVILSNANRVLTEKLCLIMWPLRPAVVLLRITRRLLILTRKFVNVLLGRPRESHFSPGPEFQQDIVDILTVPGSSSVFCEHLWNLPSDLWFFPNSVHVEIK